jgi:hypothetical protein
MPPGNLGFPSIHHPTGKSNKIPDFSTAFTPPLATFPCGIYNNQADLK